MDRSIFKDAMIVECPRCLAPPNELCRNKDRKRTKWGLPHNERVKLFMQMPTFNIKNYLKDGHN